MIREYALGFGPGILAALTMFRAYAVVRASLWAWRFGESYLTQVAGLPPEKQLDARQHLEVRRQMGGYSDFIISSYELWRQAYSRELKERPLLTFPLRALRRFWQLLVFIPTVVVATLFLAQQPRTENTFLRNVFAIFGFSQCCALFILVLALSAQAFAYVTVFRSAGGLHTGVPARYENPDKYGGGNLLLFISSVGLSWIGVIGMSVFANSRFGGFGLVPSTAASFKDIVNQIGQFTYYSLATATGVSDAEPTSPEAKFATGATIVIGMSYFLALFGSVLGTIQPSSGAAPSLDNFDEEARRVATSQGKSLPNRVAITTGQDESVEQQRQSRTYLKSACCGALAALAVVAATGTWSHRSLKRDK